MSTFTMKHKSSTKQPLRGGQLANALVAAKKRVVFGRPNCLDCQKPIVAKYALLPHAWLCPDCETKHTVAPEILDALVHPMPAVDAQLPDKPWAVARVTAVDKESGVTVFQCDDLGVL